MPQSSPNHSRYRLQRLVGWESQLLKYYRDSREAPRGQPQQQDAHVTSSAFAANTKPLIQSFLLFSTPHFLCNKLSVCHTQSVLQLHDEIAQLVAELADADFAMKCGTAAKAILKLKSTPYICTMILRTRAPSRPYQGTAEI